MTPPADLLLPGPVAAPVADAPARPVRSPAPPPPSGMSRWASLGFPALLALVFLLTMVVLSRTHAIAPLFFKDSAAAVAYTTGAALVIERLIEAGWTMFSTLKGTYWPMTGVTRYTNELVARLDAVFDPFVATATATLRTAGADLATVQQTVANLEQDIASYRDEIAQLKTQGRPGNPQTLLLSSATALRIKYLRDKYAGSLADIDRAAKLSGSVVDGLQNFVATFKDNPGRRIISLCAGGSIGIVVAALLGLDLFTALLQGGPTGSTSGSWPLAFRIALTGLVIGLGSGPTHEVIKLVQEAKAARKGANAAQPDQF